jgi:protoheme IX farnesyltransferase
MTTGVGFWMAQPGKAELQLFLPLCAGTALVVAGAHAINQWMERDVDARMRRTQHRPLPSGRLAPEAALRMGIWLSAIGLAVLAISVNSLAALLAAASWAAYILIYTPLKRVTPLCTLAGAIPGALPPLIGWAAVRGTVDAPAWTLFAILFIWQLPHFLAIAVMYRDDYARAGLPMLPLVESDGVMTARQTALYGAALIPVSLFPTVLGVSGPWYFAGAALLSTALFAVALRAAWGRSPETARQLFLASILYLPILLILLAADRAPV